MEGVLGWHLFWNPNSPLHYLHTNYCSQKACSLPPETASELSELFHCTQSPKSFVDNLMMDNNIKKTPFCAIVCAPKTQSGQTTIQSYDSNVSNVVSFLVNQNVAPAVGSFKSVLNGNANKIGVVAHSPRLNKNTMAPSKLLAVYIANQLLFWRLNNRRWKGQLSLAGHLCVHIVTNPWIPDGWLTSDKLPLTPPFLDQWWYSAHYLIYVQIFVENVLVYRAITN